MMEREREQLRGGGREQAHALPVPGQKGTAWDSLEGPLPTASHDEPGKACFLSAKNLPYVDFKRLRE